MDLLLIRTFADTADGDDLERRVGEHGVKRKKASAAIRKAIFTNSQGEPFDVTVGRRFRLDDIVYIVTERIEPGAFRVLAETVGEAGNKDFGEMIPVEPVDGLGAAILQDVLIPGENEESDESLYAKYQEHIQEKAFAGNRADYKKKIMEIQGVGGVQLFRAPQGGGTVGAIIIDSTYNEPTQELIEFVQEKIDPIEYTGEGYGTAPICHEVLISGVAAVTVDFNAQLTLSGVTLGQVEPLVVAAFTDYLAEVRKEWVTANRFVNGSLAVTPLVVRMTHIESRILSIEGVQDITGTTLNGLAENIILESGIPVAGSVTVNE
ncbi:baseplate J/gp47 family protein [Sporosarcina contaminans]|uniref:Baseplate J/gp47 family protein n=1 Tax=Sporosarcina contaminans TaxID=633403 RepID=A0ABW3TS82_9BACL